MSIDYDRLRQLVAEMEQGTAATTRYTWLDLARELLRLRRELTDLRNLMHTHGSHLYRDGQSTAANWAHDHAQRLNRIIQGDTE